MLDHFDYQTLIVNECAQQGIMVSDITEVVDFRAPYQGLSNHHAAADAVKWVNTVDAQGAALSCIQDTVVEKMASLLVEQIKAAGLDYDVYTSPDYLRLARRDFDTTVEQCYAASLHFSDNRVWFNNTQLASQGDQEFVDFAQRQLGCVPSWVCAIFDDWPWATELARDVYVSQILYPTPGSPGERAIKFFRNLKLTLILPAGHIQALTGLYDTPITSSATQISNTVVVAAHD